MMQPPSMSIVSSELQCLELKYMVPLAIEAVDFIKKFDMEQAKEKLDKLYDLGIQLVQREVRDQANSKEIVSPVVVTLNGIKWELIQHEHSIHSTLCKVYRVFIELMWYQCWNHKQTNVWGGTKSDIMEWAEQSASNLSDNYIDIKFEYKCAYAAAKLLEISDNWLKYLDNATPLAVATVTAASTGSLSPNIGMKCISTLKSLAKDLMEDKPDFWFLNVHYLKWISACVVDETDFELIQKEVKKFKKEGNEHTLCLATIFLDLIKSSTTTEGVKHLAVQKLIDLLGTETQKNFLNYALNKISSFKSYGSISEYVFPYQKTRALILQNIDGILIKDYYIFPIIDALLRIVLKEDETEKSVAKAALNKLKEEYYENSKVIDYYETEVLPATRGAEEKLSDEEKQAIQGKINESKELQDQIIDLILQSK